MDTKPKTFKVGHNGKYTPTLVRSHPTYPKSASSFQKLYRFPNGFGASVVRFPGSYGYLDGNMELAVLKFTGPDIVNYALTYDTPVAGDVLGHLDDEEVNEILEQIEALPSA